MRILVVSRAAWRNDNNIGNTLTDFFKDFLQAEIYCISLREGQPSNGVAKNNYCISEIQLIRGFFAPKKIGKIYEEDIKDRVNGIEEKIYSAAKKYDSNFLKIAREILWSFTGWRNSKLKKYLLSVNPDIVFFPVYNCYYPHKLLAFIRKSIHPKIVLFHADDNYTLEKFSLSPLYWLYRFGLRKWVRRSVTHSDLNFAISEMMADEYSQIFHMQFLLLHKFGTIVQGAQVENKTLNETCKIVFTGNLSSGRWKTIVELGRALDKINSEHRSECNIVELDIWSNTPVTSKMKKCLSAKSVHLCGSAASERIQDIQVQADILLHVESFSLRDKLEVKYSFSTKIIDYMTRRKCVLVIGPSDVASVYYFIKHKIGYVISNKNEIYNRINELVSHKDLKDKIADDISHYYSQMSKNYTRERFHEQLLQVVEHR